MSKRKLAAAVLVTTMASALSGGATMATPQEAQLGAVAAAVFKLNTRECVGLGALVGGALGASGGPLGVIGGAIVGAY